MLTLIDKGLLLDGKLIPHTEVYNLLNYDLSNVTMKELADIFRKLGCIPTNFNEYLKKKIRLYDKSESVNSFYYNGKTYWFDKDIRMGLMNLVLGCPDTVEILLGDEIVTFDSRKFELFLTNLELYANKCFINTNKHLIAVNKLNSTDTLVNYDYTAGYPEKITLINE